MCVEVDAASPPQTDIHQNQQVNVVRYPPEQITNKYATNTVPRRREKDDAKTLGAYTFLGEGAP